MDKIIDITILLASLWLINIVKKRVNKIAIATLIAGLLGIFVAKVLVNDIGIFLGLESMILAIVKTFLIPLIIVMGCTSFLRVNQLNVKGKNYIKYLIITTGVGGIISIVVSEVIGVGRKINFLRITDINFNSDIILNNVKNPFQLIATANILIIFVLSVIIGYVIYSEDKSGNSKVKYIRDLLLSIQEVIFSTIKLIFGFLPYLVFCGMTVLTFTNTNRIMDGVITVICTFYTIALLQIILVHIPLVIFVGITPKKFIKGIWKAQKYGFITQSSAGTAPIVEENLINNFNVDRDIAQSIPKVGASIGMNACQGIYPVLVTIMVSNMFGVELGFNNYILIIVLAMVLTVVFTSMPGIATLTSMTLLTIVGLPIEAIFIATISDIIIDKMRTLTNVTGVAAIAINIDGLRKYNKNSVDNNNKI